MNLSNYMLSFKQTMFFCLLKLFMPGWILFHGNFILKVWSINNLLQMKFTQLSFCHWELLFVAIFIKFNFKDLIFIQNFCYFCELFPKKLQGILFLAFLIFFIHSNNNSNNDSSSNYKLDEINFRDCFFQYIINSLAIPDEYYRYTMLYIWN